MRTEESFNLASNRHTWWHKSIYLAAIHFFSEGIEFTLKQKAKLREWLVFTAKNEKKEVGELNYIFCDDAYLLKMNQDFLQHNTLTDIITFPLDAPIMNAPKSTKKIYGEIYISIERVRENAEKYASGFERELQRVLVHGLLHLCGYKDKSEKETQQMRNKEEFYLKRFPVVN